MKIVTIIGARPQFIKAALISGNIRNNRDYRKRIKEVLVNTGQHYDYNMSKSFFNELDIPRPAYDLNVGSAPHVAQVAAMMLGIDGILKKEKPDAVLVYGDTNSTLAGALTAARSKIPVYHVEAGLRSYDKSMPEETNRVLTDHVSSILFCPTRQAVENLEKENIREGVYNVGDIMYELAIDMSKTASKRSGIMKRLGLKKKGYILATIHRESNTDIKSNLSSIAAALRRIDTDIVFPVHPRTKKMLKAFGLLKKLETGKRIKIIPPVGYLDMICLENNARKIITDSGGVQKEAFFFRVPCITLRENSEWTETLNNGWNRLVGTDAGKIVAAAQKKYALGPHPAYYGNGSTSDKIINIIIKGKAS